MDHFNQLTPAETERLAMLAEECSEVIQMVGKILRHGYGSHHPNDPGINNRRMLHSEITDLFAVVTMMADARDIHRVDPSEVSAAARRKLEWAHHQDPQE